VSFWDTRNNLYPDRFRWLRSLPSYTPTHRGSFVAASPAALWLSALADQAGRIVIGEDLRVAGLDVFAIGDTVAVNA
jgi:hypothetical protein